MFVPISRILSKPREESGTIIYLEFLSPKISLRHECSKANSTLHPGKGLAVSPPWLPKGFIPKKLGMPLPFDYRRHCSHLACYHGQALPATLFRQWRECPDFPHSPKGRAIVCYKQFYSIPSTSNNKRKLPRKLITNTDSMIL